MPKVTKEFDKLQYDKQYRKDHYKQITVVLDKETAQKVADASSKENISKSQYIKTAVLEKLNRL